MVRRKRGRANLEPRGSPGANKFTGEKMGFKAEYGDLLDQIAQEADAIALRYFRADELRVDRKGDGTAGAQAGRGGEERARGEGAGGGLRTGRAWGRMWGAPLLL